MKTVIVFIFERMTEETIHAMKDLRGSLIGKIGTLHLEDEDLLTESNTITLDCQLHNADKTKLSRYVRDEFGNVGIGIVFLDYGIDDNKCSTFLQLM